MPDPSERTFHAIKKHFAILYAEWCIYGQLFGSTETVALLNESAANVFVILQNSILDNCVLAFSRFTDNESTGRNKNLSLPRLVNDVRKEDGTLADELQQTLDELTELVARFRDHRHKRIAHLDLETATARRELKPYKFGDIQRAFDLVESILNTYENKIYNSTTLYRDTILPLGADGNSLLELLKKGREAKEKEAKERIASLLRGERDTEGG